MALTKLRGNIITAGTVSKTEIENLTVTADKIADLTITNAKIANGTIENSKLATPPSAGITTGKSIAMAIVFG